MAKHNNIIELNGVRYDARTGRLLDGSVPATQSAQPLSKNPQRTIQSHAQSLRAGTKMPATAIHRQKEASKTLMRKTVAKPAQAKRISRISHAIGNHAPAHSDTTRTPEAASSNRTPSTQKSQFINRFGGTVKHTFSPLTAHLPVKTAPAEPLPQRPLQSQAAPTAPDNPFMQAMQGATSHTERPLRKRSLSRRIGDRLGVSHTLIQAGSLGIALMAIGGYFVFANLPQISLQMAATRSGVNGSIPAYKPAGFALDKNVTYNPGEIIMNFKAHTDDRSYTITQKTSNWNSETLLDSFVAKDKRSFQTRQDNGKTVYIYDGSNATWVDGGVWYRIEGKSSLSSDQLLRIVDSL